MGTSRQGFALVAGRSFPLEEQVDAVVIGTGAGGAPILARLANAGLSVVALEAGRWWNPPVDYALDEVSHPELYWLDERLSAGGNPTAFGVNNSGCGVGGSTLHYGAYVPRAQPCDFSLQTQFGVGVDWPIPYAELVPYYEEVERYLGVSGPEDYPWSNGYAREYLLPPVALNGPAQLMQSGCSRAGITTACAPLATRSQRFSNPAYGCASACSGCGYCHQGCWNGSKASMDVTFVREAVNLGVEVRPNSFVHSFERNEKDMISAVIYRHEGRDIRQKTKNVFLCAGAIETPRLLLHNEIGNASGQVGRNFMVHSAAQVWGEFPQDVRPYKGFPASLITEDFIRPKDPGFAGGYLLQSLGVVPNTWAQGVVRGRGLWGKPLRDHLQKFNHMAGIGMNGDCLPYALNYLELSDELDDRGLPKPRIHYTHDANSRAMIEHADKIMREIWAAAGGEDLWTLDRTAHTIGTCRMGNHDDTSVVTSVGRSFEISNLWISDNSTFPSALPANPALTICALALRTADAFLGG